MMAKHACHPHVNAIENVGEVCAGVHDSHGRGAFVGREPFRGGLAASGEIRGFTESQHGPVHAELQHAARECVECSREEPHRCRDTVTDPGAEAIKKVAAEERSPRVSQLEKHLNQAVSLQAEVELVADLRKDHAKNRAVQIVDRGREK
jgi:hypothetical protein